MPLLVDTSPQLVGYPLITDETVRKQPFVLNKNKWAKPDDIHSAVLRLLAGITSGPVCKLFRAV